MNIVWVLLLLILKVVYAREVYICSGAKPDLCLGVRKEFEVDDKINLRSMSSTLPRNDTRKFLGWEIGNGTEVIQLRNESFFIGASVKYAVLKKVGTHFKLPFMEEKLTEYFGGIYAYSSKRCLTILKCNRKTSVNGNPFCVDEETNPVQSAEEIVKGAFIQLRSCQEPMFTEFDDGNTTISQSNSIPISQYFSIKYQCAPGCEFEFLGNGVCDEECNVKTCVFDNGECTGSPTTAPTSLAPTTKEPTGYPTKKGQTVTPTFDPTFAPVIALPPSVPVITTTAPTTSPTRLPTHLPTKKPSLSPIKAPTKEPVMITTFPTIPPFTFPPTKDYTDLIVTLLQLTNILEEEILKLDEEFHVFIGKSNEFISSSLKYQKTLIDVAQEMSDSIEHHLTVIFGLSVAILCVVVICLFGIAGIIYIVERVITKKMNQIHADRARLEMLITNLSTKLSELEQADLQVDIRRRGGHSANMPQVPPLVVDHAVFN